MKNKNVDTIRRLRKFIVIVLVSVISFNLLDFSLSEITDTRAYKDAIRDDAQWEEIMDKIEKEIELTDEDYENIFLQSGLGRPAVDNLSIGGNTGKLNYYREYYVSDKDYYCYRKGVFACHENITDSNGEQITNPYFADLQNGDIILTLSIHSLGWRHGHATIITDAERGIGVQAVMVGEKSAHSYVSSWMDYPLVAVLRPKNTDKETRDAVALFAEQNLIGLDYTLLGGITSGRNAQKVPRATQCAHLVWYAYFACGIDIAPESGLIITPKDILHSDSLEIVQVYGSILEV